MTVLSVMSFKNNRIAQDESLQNKSLQEKQSSLFPGSDRAIVSQAIASNHLGRIYYQNTYWFGCGLNNVNIPEGTVVKVLEH